MNKTLKTKVYRYGTFFKNDCVTTVAELCVGGKVHVTHMIEFWRDSADRMREQHKWVDFVQCNGRCKNNQPLSKEVNERVKTFMATGKDGGPPINNILP